MLYYILFHFTLKQRSSSSAALICLWFLFSVLNDVLRISVCVCVSLCVCVYVCHTPSTGLRHPFLLGVS